MSEILIAAGVFLAGLLLRAALFVGIFALLALPVVLVLGATLGWDRLREKAAGLARVGGVLFAPHRRYTPGHAWLVPDRVGGGLRVGLDDLARRLFPGVQGVLLARPGAELASGDTLAEIILPGERRVAIPAPFAAKVISDNDSLLSNPSLFEKEPFGRGWLLRLAPKDDSWKSFPREGEAKSWLLAEEIKLARLFESELGYAAADGGELIGPAATLLPPETWRKVVREMLGTNA
jgi:glycine cleavage system H protein